MTTNDVLVLYLLPLNLEHILKPMVLVILVSIIQNENNCIFV